MGMKKRCQKGKSCGGTCISRVKLCLLDLGELTSKNLNFLKKKFFPKKSENFQFVLSDRDKLEEFFNGRIRKLRKAGLTDKATALEKEKDLAKSRLPVVQKFLRDLKNNLPEGSKLISDNTNLNIRLITNSGDKVDVYFSPKKGFHVRVNDQISVGSVKTKEGQQQAIKAVKDLFAAVSNSLPVGAVMKTKALMDEKGSRRITLYKRMGFSDPVPPKGWMFAVKTPDGKIKPAPPEVFDSYANTPGNLFFSEFPS